MNVTKRKFVALVSVASMFVELVHLHLLAKEFEALFGQARCNLSRFLINLAARSGIHIGRQLGNTFL